MMDKRIEIELDEHLFDCISKLCERDKSQVNGWIVDAILQKMRNARTMIRLQYGDEEASKYE